MQPLVRRIRQEVEERLAVEMLHHLVTERAHDALWVVGGEQEAGAVRQELESRLARAQRPLGRGQLAFSIANLRSARRSSVTSRKTSTTPSSSPLSLRTGAALSEIEIRRPSRLTRAVWFARPITVPLSMTLRTGLSAASPVSSWTMWKILAQRPAGRLRLREAGQLFGDAVQHDRATRRIRGDDRVADAPQRDQEALLGGPPLRLCALAVGDVRERDRKIALARAEGGDRVPPVERCRVALELQGRARQRHLSVLADPVRRILLDAREDLRGPLAEDSSGRRAP